MRKRMSPTVLIVDDHRDTLETRRDLLTEHGFVSIAASSYTQAISEIKEHPEIALVVVDVNLDRRKPRDDSGVNLARYVRESGAGIPVVGYSAVFAEDDPRKKVQWEVFDRHLSKGRSSHEHILKELRTWRRLAVAANKRRVGAANREIQNLFDKYSIEPSELATLRGLVPCLPGGNGSHGPEVKDPNALLLAGLSEIDRRLAGIDRRLEALESAAKPNVVVLKEISREEAKKEIRELFAAGKALDYEDIVQQLSIPLEDVVDICDELLREGEIG